MQRKIKVTMPKSKKQLEHTLTFIDENLSGHTHIYFHHRESIISDLRSKEIKFTTLQDSETENTEETLIKIGQEVD